MVDKVRYVPILKLKTAECSALKEMSSHDGLLPLIELTSTPAGLPASDFLEKSKGVVEDALKRVGRAMMASPFMMESVVPESLHGLHPLEIAGNEMAEFGGKIIPVVRPNASRRCIEAAKKVVALNHSELGAAIRFSIDTWEDPDVVARQVLQSVESLSLETKNCYLIADIGDIGQGTGPARAFLKGVGEELRRFDWNAFVLAATSFPESLPIGKNETSFIDRHEWKLFLSYSQFSGRIGEPIFGDYAISSSHHREISTPGIKVPYSLRYTLAEQYFLLKGGISNRAPEEGDLDIRDLCKILVGSKHFYGEDFSWGDKWIAECASGRLDSSGSPAKWRQVGFSHHIAVALSQTSSLEPLT